METWNPTIRRTVYLIMNNPEPRIAYFGKDCRAMIYNEACSKLLGRFHPAHLGSSGATNEDSVWHTYKIKGVQEVMSTGVISEEKDLYYPIPRGDLALAEAYFSWYLLPIMGDDGCVGGVVGEFYETTSRVINDRRIKTVQAAEQMDPSDNISGFWSQVRDIIESNQEDFPFSLLYSVSKDPCPSDAGFSALKDIIPGPIKLEGAVGLSDNHPLVKNHFALNSFDYPLGEHFGSAWIRRKAVLLNVDNQTLPQCLQIEIEGRGHGAVCHSAVLYPIRRIDGHGCVGFLLLGLNPQRPYDEPFRRFTKSLAHSFVRTAAAIIVPEEREKLLLEKKRAEEQERIFTQLAMSAPVGFAVFNADGTLVWQNNVHKRDTNIQMVQIDELNPVGYWIPEHPDDKEPIRAMWKRIIEIKDDNKDHQGISFQFRVKKNIHHDADPDVQEHWRSLLAHVSPVYDEREKTHKVISVVTDITPEKEESGRRLENALEMKRQSENFIDMTCHEMRNPLSAIIQSADGIVAMLALTTPPAPKTNDQPLMDYNHNNVLDSAQTILLCAQHQKRILDDILTLSKLDSNCIQICPHRVIPVTLVERALKMYEAELSDAEIRASFTVDQSYINLGLDYVLLDTARILQILINLLTNAIKFTRKETRKKISIVLTASRNLPLVGTEISFIPRRTSCEGVFSRPEWGNGEEVFLQFDVCDTGKGLTAEEMTHLFRKFSQASRKTYSQYGGSGLGLFISRELTELHGGQIGVSSVDGQGSTFAFFVKARRYQSDSADSRPQLIPDEALPSAQPVKESVTASMEYTDAATTDLLMSRTNLMLPSQSSTLHILLVEDNLINQRVTAGQLRKAGCTVHVANHGLECLEFLERSWFWRETKTPSHKLPLSVILLDQEMPIMDGLTCVRRIRAMEETGELTARIPVIACTANARREQVVESLEAGMDTIVTKPFRIPNLIPKIFDLIDQLKSPSSRTTSAESGDSDATISS
ncbi:histidine kinase [Dendryphion nanum]|uniref:Histidine kinase n=1 Tax=Dendryphion nanum TaxID=256645 RepID=A0A9P9IDM5_9PLEO|nr:histidine kinase [Dendryphion nanum]